MNGREGSTGMRWMRGRVIFICTGVLPSSVQMCLHLYRGVSPPSTNVGIGVYPHPVQMCHICTRWGYAPVQMQG
jgi:hypothetical protein